MTTPSEMMNVAQAANFLGISPKSVYALVAAKKLPHYRFGLGRGNIKFLESALQQFVEASSVPAMVGPNERATAPVTYHPRGHKHIRPKGQRTARKGA